MNIRKMYYNNSWYPGDKENIHTQFAEWQKSGKMKYNDATAAVVPHAGWYYSGQLAFDTISGLKRTFNDIIVCGGHLGKNNGFMIPEADAWETPLGNISINNDILQKIKNNFSFYDDNMKDNTIEIQLPIIKYFFPDARIIPIRLSPDESAIQLAGFLFELDENLCIVGSTDFSHYGPNYNYLKYGIGKKAEDMIRKNIDKKLVEYLVECDTAKSLEWSEATRSACSIGAAVCAAEYARLSGKKGYLLHYYLSSDIIKDSSFVGYAGIYYR